MCGMGRASCYPTRTLIHDASVRNPIAINMRFIPTPIAGHWSYSVSRPSVKAGYIGRRAFASGERFARVVLPGPHGAAMTNPLPRLVLSAGTFVVAFVRDSRPPFALPSLAYVRL